MLDRVDGAIARRADDWIRRANLLAQAGDFREAEATLARARELAPRAPGLDAASAALERQRQGLAAESARRASEERSRATSRIPAQPSAQQERDLAEYYRRGQVALEAGRSDEALRYWELVWAIRPGYQRVDDYLKREYLTRGMEQFAAGRLLESISLWERALKVDPKDERALGYLARAHEQLDRARAIAGEGP
jgi:tetratricopeptide (TPR) repeat protein